jgi:hypothetical protein
MPYLEECGTEYVSSRLLPNHGEISASVGQQLIPKEKYCLPEWTFLTWLSEYANTSVVEHDRHHAIIRKLPLQQQVQVDFKRISHS